MSDSSIISRKKDHININLDEDVSSERSTGLSAFHFLHNALPEIDLSAVDTAQSIFGKVVRLPILISSMTGGTTQAAEINQRLAIIAEKFGLAMGVGSQRVAIDNPNLSESFKIRKYSPSILLFANIGAVQLNYGYGLDECKQAIDMIDADALILHLNPLQEAIQLNGNTNFGGLLNKIEEICKLLNKPVIIKEVGWGISSDLAEKLVNVGVSGIDVSGAGGTSWSQVERYRLKNEGDIRVAESFRDWGIPTADALLQLVEKKINALIISSGGLQTGMDIAKSIAIGANLAGMASTFLKKAVASIDDLSNEVKIIERIIRISMFVTGSQNIAQFQNSKILKSEKPS
ncbi:MAG: type 2 isopentenyl-diphosphate Delta-isomerase [Chloroflexi bacterium HGW-Chloroflexi-8]|nr:MAG: type 2 isopentenyl-diphosphate Delta-isomerase [Chloroflexi bacterium HGW-Chloroflexi-8]